MKDALSGLVLGLLAGDFCKDKALIHSSAPMASGCWGWAGVDGVIWSWAMAALERGANWVKAPLWVGLNWGGGVEEAL